MTLPRRLHFGGRLRPRRLGAHIRDSAICRHNVGHILIVLFQLHKVGNVEEGIALQANVNEGRLHARQHAGYAAFVDGPCQRVFIFAFEVDFGEKIVFHQAHLGFVGRGRDKQLLIHGHSGPALTHSRKPGGLHRGGARKETGGSSVAILAPHGGRLGRGRFLPGRVRCTSLGIFCTFRFLSARFVTALSDRFRSGGRFPASTSCLKDKSSGSRFKDYKRWYLILLNQPVHLISFRFRSG